MKLITRLALLMCFSALAGCARSPNNSIAEQSNPQDDTRYDEVVWLCTHNAYNAEETGFRYVNQTHGIKRQLGDGVRALMLDVWEADGEIVLRHSDKLTMLLGQQPLSEALTTIRQFLEKNPDAIVTLIFESYVPVERIEKCLVEADLIENCHSQNRDEGWPTLKIMRSKNKRLVVFTDRAEGGPDWYMPIWDHCFETHWESNTQQDLLDNQSGRGDTANSLFIVNHFLSNPLKSSSVAGKINRQEFLEKRFNEPNNLPRRANFIAVDFYEVGDCLSFVDSLNEPK